MLKIRNLIKENLDYSIRSFRIWESSSVPKLLDERPEEVDVGVLAQLQQEKPVSQVALR